MQLRATAEHIIREYVVFFFPISPATIESRLLLAVDEMSKISHVMFETAGDVIPFGFLIFIFLISFSVLQS